MQNSESRPKDFLEHFGDICLSPDGVTMVNLQPRNLSSTDCSKLAEHLKTRQDSIYEIDLEDSLLSQGSLALLLRGIACAKAIPVMNLKGNNLGGDNIAFLGHILKQSQSIKRLCLPWNDVGLSPEAFRSFCAGLQSNSSLNVLDLRNNALNYRNAQQLADALRSGARGLKILDLRWNNLGSLGGSAFLGALDSNHTLLDLRLEGNLIASETITTINHILHQNSESNRLINEQKERTNFLEEKVKSVKSQLSNQDRLQKLALDGMEKDFQSKNDSIHFEVGSLKEALNQRILEEDALKEKLRYTQQAHRLAEDQVNDLLRRDENREEHLQKIHGNCNTFEKQIRQEWITKEESYLSEIQGLTELVTKTKGEIVELQSERTALERSGSRSQIQGQEERGQLLHQIQGLKSKLDNTVQDHAEQIERWKKVQEHEQSQILQSAHYESNKLKQNNLGLEEEVQNLKGLLESSRAELRRNEQEHQCAVAKLKNSFSEDKTRIHLDHETKTDAWRTESDELQLEIQVGKQRLTSKLEQIQSMEEAIKKINLENDELTKGLEQMRRERITIKEDIRQEFRQELSESVEDKERLVDLDTKLQISLKKFRILEEEYKKDMEFKNRELNELKATIQGQKSEMATLRDNEEKRKTHLASALNGILNPS